MRKMEKGGGRRGKEDGGRGRSKIGNKNLERNKMEKRVKAEEGEVV